jgi:hypothetical protein
MEDSDKTKLDELRKKHPGSLTESDRAFLTARRSYLQPHELQAFGIVEAELQDPDKQPEEAKDEVIPEDAPVPVKPAKKPKAKAKDEVVE